MGEGDGLRADKAFQSFPGKFLHTLSTFTLTQLHQIRTPIRPHPSLGTQAIPALLRPSSALKYSKAARSVSRIRAYLRNPDQDMLHLLQAYTKMSQRLRQDGSSTLSTLTVCSIGAIIHGVGAVRISYPCFLRVLLKDEWTHTATKPSLRTPRRTLGFWTSGCLSGSSSCLRMRRPMRRWMRN